MAIALQPKLIAPDIRRLRTEGENARLGGSPGWLAFTCVGDHLRSMCVYLARVSCNLCDHN